MPKSKLLLRLLFSLIVLCFTALPAFCAAPPVRISVVAGTGDGIEQDVVDQISNQLQENKSVALGTVNPDWIATCTIQQMVDSMSGQIRCNGSVVVKTPDGQVISNTAVQKYNQDFSLTPMATANKTLVDGAARDCARMLTARAVQPILQAVDTEMEVRDRMIHAVRLGDDDKFDEAVEMIRPINPDTPHFDRVRNLIKQLQMEQDAMEAVQKAEALHAQGKNPGAIATLRTVPKASKRYPIAQRKIAQYKPH